MWTRILRVSSQILESWLRVYRVEQIEYDKTEFFSDVGGAAGLLLGISLTSLIGMLGES